MEFDDGPVLEHHVVGEVMEDVGRRLLVGVVENDEDVDVAGPAVSFATDGRAEDVQLRNLALEPGAGTIGERYHYGGVGIGRRGGARSFPVAHTSGLRSSGSIISLRWVALERREREVGNVPGRAGMGVLIRGAVSGDLKFVDDASDVVVKVTQVVSLLNESVYRCRMGRRHTRLMTMLNATVFELIYFHMKIYGINHAAS